MKYIAKKCRWRLSNIQQSYDGHMDEMLKELDELERLAEIGRATEKAFNYFSMESVDDEGNGQFCMLRVEELLEWYKESEAK